MKSQREPLSLTYGQARAMSVLSCVPEELMGQNSKSSVLVGVARHLMMDLGVACEVFQAQVGNSDRHAGTEYLMVDGLRISRWGEVGDQQILRGAFRRDGSIGAPPKVFRFMPNQVDTRHPPAWFGPQQEQLARRVQGWLRKQQLAQQATGGDETPRQAGTTNGSGTPLAEANRRAARM